MSPQDVFGLVAMFYAVANLGSMGLELKLGETIRSLKSVRVLGLTLGWSWIVGPAFAVLLTEVLPMTEAYATGLTVSSWAIGKPLLLTVLLPLVVDLIFAMTLYLLPPQAV